MDMRTFNRRIEIFLRCFTVRKPMLLYAMLCSGLSCIQAQTISLDTVLQRIEIQNPMLKEYDSKVQAFNEYSKGAKSWMAPMVGGGTFMTPYPGQTLMDERDKGSLMLSIEQSIPNPAKQNANQNYLRSRAGIEGQNRAIKFNELRSEAKFLYLQSVVATKKLTALNESERIIELMLKLARIRYPYNQGSLGNIYKAEGRLSEVQNMRLMTISQIENNESRLQSLMNMRSTDSIRVDTTTNVYFNVQQLAADTTSLNEHRSDVRQIDLNIESMQLNQLAQRSLAKPDFRLRFDHMQPIGNMPTQFTAMAMISIPIAPWSSRMYRSEIKGMQYDIEAMKSGRQAILLETKGMLTGMGRQILRMQQQLENYKSKIIPALRKNYQTLMLAYEENREQLPLVIDGWEALNMAQLDYLEKQEEYYKMIVTYEKEAER